VLSRRAEIYLGLPAGWREQCAIWALRSHRSHACPGAKPSRSTVSGSGISIASTRGDSAPIFFARAAVCERWNQTG